jgi:hypothetical protein
MADIRGEIGREEPGVPEQSVEVHVNHDHRR